MVTDPLPERDDESLPELTQLDADAAPVDSGLLNKLRDQSTREFQTAQSTPDGSRPRVAVSTKGNHKMLATSKLVVSLTATVVTAIAAFLGGLGGDQESQAAPVTFGDVLKRAASAETLKLKVINDGDEASVLVSRSGQVRWDDSPTQYRIASGSRLWRVDEKTNTAKPGASPWFRDEQTPVDLLAMLSAGRIDAEASARFRKTVSAGRAVHNGRACRVFRMKITTGDHPLTIEALADQRTNELYTITAWPEGPRNQNPPLAELRLLARNIPVDESQFVVGRTLSNDGRIGKIIDAQGMVSLRPVMAHRWTPVCRQLVVKPGDWVRTDIRGANAVKVTLTSQVQITLGPGSLLELLTPFKARIHSGELQVSVPPELDRDSFDLLGPGGQTKTLTPSGPDANRTFLRVHRGETLMAQKDHPMWLQGFEGSSNNESLGSLIANVDGRNVPLTVGYHKVKVEIRDQIARTTIEESFVNHTKSRLEGVFHFPLPQDASISGFGMWINGELIEADVVEKQRAREIYETILRERRDPGLLEWTGGNIFKARVFPIEARSEKRIKIVYTQVLPLRGNQYRYSYGLRSELLRNTPVRDLSIDVFVNSELPLKSVTCGTHSVRSDNTDHSAHIEFSAQEYTPERDFEVICEIDAQQSDVVMIPHRRGDDGYFLVQLSPPGTEGNFQREVLPDGDPIKLLLICDTSSSMDAESRKKQSAFVTAMLRSLGPDDRFNVAVSDVETRWLLDESSEATDDTIASVRDTLGKRLSLGWTDLDKAFASVDDVAEEGCHVVYIGDGIVTARDPDPQAFVTRFGLLFGDEAPGTFHAVSVSSSFESVVLKAIAGVSRGSVRSINGERTPQEIALELLNEMAQPGLTDLNIQFRGLQVAAVYPEKLPNVAAGTQQILIGRYLPQEEDQSGQIVVTGKRGGEDVKYVARVSLKDAEKGNSFVPRLWARAHLDQLLQQGSSQQIRDEIIAMSEEFHIMTPYTSLLVLESDADRDRFGVKRRFLMRDGERFFADGRENANYELLQQQMRRAGEWRLGLRRQVLMQLARLGRNHEAIQQLQKKKLRSLQKSNERFSGDREIYALAAMVAGDGSAVGNARSQLWFSDGPDADVNGMAGLHGMLPSLFEGGEGDSRMNQPSPMDMNRPARKLAMIADKAESMSYDLKPGMELVDLESDDLLALDSIDGVFTKGKASARQSMPGLSSTGMFGPVAVGAKGPGYSLNAQLMPMSSPASAARAGRRGSGRGEYYNQQPGYTGWVDQLFPSLDPPGTAPKAIPTRWPDDALALSRALLRTDALRNLDGGLEIRIARQNRDARWNRVISRTNTLELYAPDRWLKRPTQRGTHTVVNWCDQTERGTFSKMFNLGRVRESVDHDHDSVVIGLHDYSQAPIHESWRNHAVVVRKLDAGRSDLEISSLATDSVVARVTIDTERNVVLRIVSLDQEKVLSTIAFSDFLQVAGSWWAGKSTTTDAAGRETAVVTQSVELHNAAAFATRFDGELASKQQIQFVRLPFVTIPDAETSEKDGSASFEHRLALLLRASMIQNWDEAIDQLEELEKLAVDGSGVRFIRSAVLQAARNNEDVRQFLLVEAHQVSANPTQDDFQLAQTLLTHAAAILDANEQIELLDRLRPVFARQPAHLSAMRAWTKHRVTALRNLGRTEEYLALQRELATTAEWDLEVQIQYARALAEFGEASTAYVWLDREIGLDVQRLQYEYDRLFSTYYDLLNQEGRYADLVTITTRWLKASPASSDACRRHLGALVYADQTAAADAKCLQWLNNCRIETQLDEATLQRVNAAVEYANGSVYGSYYHVMDPKWFTPLQETARFFVSHEHHFSIAQNIINNSRFRDTHEADLLRDTLFASLIETAGTLEQDRLTPIVRWCLSGPTPAATGADWQKVADVLLKRWQAAEDFDTRLPLGHTLLSVYSAHLDDRTLPFMRRRIERAPDDEKAQLRQYLFNALLQKTWQDDYELEAFTLLPFISPDTGSGRGIGVLIDALHRLVDGMLAGRQNVAKADFQDQEHPEELTRIALAAKHREFLVSAREGLARRLASETKRLRGLPRQNDAEDSAATDSLADWLQIERMTLDVRLNRELDTVSDECWAWLGDEPPAIEEADTEAEADEDETDNNDASPTFPLFDAALRQRAFAILSNLIARASATPQSRQQLIDFVQVGVDRDDSLSAGWKSIKYYLLIALDDPQSLERDLREWIRTDEYSTPWRRALAMLVAEQGQLEEAIAFYETIERDSQLTPGDYATLAGWYLVVDNRERYRRSKVESFKVWQEYQISNWINQQLNPWQRSDQNLPSELDENVLFAFQALFEKSNGPGSYLYQLRSFYTACRDFRLLNMLADSVVGRTPQQVYSFLGSIRTTVLEEVRDEAVADEILGRITELRTNLRQAGREVTAIDLRALDLLEAMVERKAAEVLNQPGPHVEKSLAALRRAFERDWAEGEHRQMAELLKNLGRITHNQLATEQLRQLKALYDSTEPGTDDRLWIGWYYGHCEFSSYGRRDVGLAHVENAVNEYEATHTDGWPSHVNTVLSGYITMLTGISRHATAERVVNRHLENPLNDSQRYWLTQQMDDVYISALSAQGTVSLGRGETLYGNILTRLLKAAETDNHNHRYQTTQKILALFDAAKRRFLEYKGDMRTYAFEQLPQILERQTNNYRTIVDRTAHRLKDLIDTRTGLAFYISRIENYPVRLMRSWENPWQQFGYRVAQWRRDVGNNIGDLEPRLLKLVLDELRRDLRTRNQRNRYLYHTDYGYFWSEKRDDFARVVEEVYADLKHSRRYVEYIGLYLYHGLDHYSRAIEILLVAHSQGILEQSGQATVCQWLHEQKRYGESIPILEPMVALYPDTMDYRCRLITAYHHTQRFEQRDELLAAVNEHFRQGGRWIEHNVAQLANCTRLIRLYTQSVDLYGEVIPLHQRTAPNQGIGNETLSRYYRYLADAHSGLGQTKEAVDAAASAIVAWGPRYELRQSAILNLRNILRNADDLDEYVAYLDEQLEKTGKTSPIVRQLIGRVYVDKSQHQKAITQLKLALELQPGDIETHKQLTRAYDSARDAEGAVTSVLARLNVDRHNLELYRDLANRLASDVKLAERAATTIVEAAPNEAEHHAALATHRESQKRWSDAVAHWKHAARLRALEPTNLVKLAEAQIKGGMADDATRTLNKLSTRNWPSRFENQLRQDKERLRRMLEQAL